MYITERIRSQFAHSPGQPALLAQPAGSRRRPNLGGRSVTFDNVEDEGEDSDATEVGTRDRVGLGLRGVQFGADR